MATSSGASSDCKATVAYPSYFIWPQNLISCKLAIGTSLLVNVAEPLKLVSCSGCVCATARGSAPFFLCGSKVLRSRKLSAVGCEEKSISSVPWLASPQRELPRLLQKGIQPQKPSEMEKYFSLWTSARNSC